MRYLLSIIVVMLIPLNSHAAVAYCENVYIKEVFVQGDRDDNSFFENSLVLTFKKKDGQDLTCQGKSYVYLNETSPAYNGMLSIALTAFAAEYSLKVAVNTSKGGSNSYEVAYIRINK